MLYHPVDGCWSINISVLEIIGSLMDRQEVFLIHFGIHFGGPKLSLTKTHFIVRCPANTIGPVCLKMGVCPKISQNGNFDGKNDD